MATRFVGLKTVGSATPDTIERLKAALPGIVKSETVFPDASDLELAHLYVLTVDENSLDETLALLNQDEEVECAYATPSEKSILMDLMEKKKRYSQKKTPDCRHECTCPCHEHGGMHVIACCYPCKICNRKINHLLMDEHLKECHPDGK